jgi:transketolase
VRLNFDGATNFEPGSFGGRQVHYGIREHAAATACNGMSLCKLRPLWSTYLTFSDYGRPGIRLSAIMELPVIHLFTHDSISLGEDGPTHQPIEQLASLRAMPHLDVIRPGDANEVTEAWRLAIGRIHNPVALVLTRQNVPVIDHGRYASAEGVRRGGYVVADPEDGDPELILIATGSELPLAVKAHELLAGEGVRSRVVSLPCWELFDRQDQEYRDEVLPPDVRTRVAVEQAATLGWERYVGEEGTIVGMHTFGQSAPFKDIEAEFGFTPEKVASAAREAVGAKT